MLRRGSPYCAEVPIELTVVCGGGVCGVCLCETPIAFCVFVSSGFLLPRSLPLYQHHSWGRITTLFLTTLAHLKEFIFPLIVAPLLNFTKVAYFNYTLASWFPNSSGADGSFLVIGESNHLSAVAFFYGQFFPPFITGFIPRHYPFLTCLTDTSS